MEWYRLTKEELFSNLESDEDGLDAISRQERLAKEGPNELSKGEEISEIRKFLSHFNDLLVYALIVSAALKGFIGDFIDMAIILFVVLVNALIGYIQEAKATDSLNSLSNMMSANAVIWTGNEKVTVDAASLVKGDIVYSRISNYIFTIKNRMARDTCENENKMFLLFVTVIFKWNLCKKTGSSFD